MAGWIAREKEQSGRSTAMDITHHHHPTPFLQNYSLIDSENELR